MSQNVLTIANATLTYPDGTRSVAALDHVSLQARAGQLTAIVGESGSGKSTVLSAAAGLAVPDSGTITVAGLVLSDAPEATRTRIRRDHIGMIFQSPNLLASLTVAEQLLITSHIRGQRPGAGSGSVPRSCLSSWGWPAWAGAECTNFPAGSVSG